jgi:hypothetical protein
VTAEEWCALGDDFRTLVFKVKLLYALENYFGEQLIERLTVE